MSGDGLLGAVLVALGFLVLWVGWGAGAKSRQHSFRSEWSVWCIRGGRGWAYG